MHIHTRYLHDMAARIIVLTCVCACAMGYSSSNQNRGLDNLANLIDELKKELHLDTKTETLSVNDLKISPVLQTDDESTHNSFPGLRSLGTTQLQNSPLLSALLSKTSDDESSDQFLGFDINKRQGSWDYDYGLGGGRFGKRSMLMDYSFGGGRFGRDVNHVIKFQDEDVDHVDPLED